MHRAEIIRNVFEHSETGHAVEAGIIERQSHRIVQSYDIRLAFLDDRSVLSSEGRVNRVGDDVAGNDPEMKLVQEIGNVALAASPVEHVDLLRRTTAVRFKQAGKECHLPEINSLHGVTEEPMRGLATRDVGQIGFPDGPRGKPGAQLASELRQLRLAHGRSYHPAIAETVGFRGLSGSVLCHMRNLFSMCHIWW